MIIGSSRLLIRVALLTTAAVFTPAAAVRLNAQTSRVTQAPVTTPPARLLADFENAERRGQRAVSGPGSEIVIMFVHRRDYPARTIEALLEGLEQIALHSTSPEARHSAASLFSIPGRRSVPSPMPGMTARTIALYRHAGDPDVRRMLASTLALSAEKAEAAAFLRSLALQTTEDEDFPDAAVTALSTLPGLGEEGRTALRELHASGQVRDPEARSGLDELARHDFRIPYSGRSTQPR